MKKIFLSSFGILMVMLSSLNSTAQNVGIGTNTPNASAVLDLTSTTKGLLIPRMTSAQRAAIVTPATGLLVYQTDGTPGLYYNTGTPALPVWTVVPATGGGGSGWSLTGNAGTSAAANFIGTTDANPLVFKLNNGYAGQISDQGLVSFGRGAVGTEMTNVPGIVAIGDSALFNNTQDSSEIAIGNQAQYSSSTPGNGDNVAVGNLSMVTSTSGFQNVAVGNYSLLLNDTAYSNVAIGYGAAAYTSESYNTAVGAEALEYDSIGIYNSALGYASLISNTTGFSNTGIGEVALLNNTTGNRNTAVGRAGMANLTTGLRNTTDGYYCLVSLSTGSKNIGIGAYAGRILTTGSNNILIGDSATVAAATTSNAIAIGTDLGSAVYRPASNAVRIGNASMTSIGGQVGWSTLSDARYKKDVVENVKGLDFIMQLRPVTYAYDFDRINGASTSENQSAIAMPSRASRNLTLNTKNGKKNLPALGKTKMHRAGNLLIATEDKQNDNGIVRLPNPNEGVRFTGFLAQEVEAAATKVGFQFSGVDKPATEDGTYSLRYAEFVVPLVKAVQEQQAIIDAQNKKIESLEQRLEKLETKN